jgi:hypothetical protein
MEMITYTCETCKKIFNRKSSYTNHTERKKYPCVIQTIFFKTTVTVPNPVIPAVNKPIKSYNCTKCNYKTTRTDNYNRHVAACEINNQKLNKEELLRKQEDEIKKLSEQIKTILTANKNILDK